MFNNIKKLADRISELKIARNAVVLAHNYQLPEVQDIADFCGDSLELAQKAVETKADVIVFCGVHFMAETAAILCPEKRVLLPDEHAGCPMADMANAADLKALKIKHPNARVVCYVNSTAEVKALSDVCCTSSNASAIVSRFEPETELIFVPDKYLGAHVEQVTGRKLILWPGYCPTHARFAVDDIYRARMRFPDAPIVVHPECRAEVSSAADAVLSTGGMVRFAADTKLRTVIVGTEIGLLHRLQRLYPEKEFVPLNEKAVCNNMKKIDLGKIIESLEDMKTLVTVEKKLAKAASLALRRMIDER